MVANKFETVAVNLTKMATANLNKTFPPSELMKHGSNVGDNLTNADLRNIEDVELALLNGRGLRGADLSGLQLLYGSYLDADFSGANLKNTKVDLRKFLGTIHSVGSTLPGTIACTYWESRWDELPHVQFMTDNKGHLLAKSDDPHTSMIIGLAVDHAIEMEQLPKEHPYMSGEDYKIVNDRVAIRPPIPKPQDMLVSANNSMSPTPGL